MSAFSLRNHPAAVRPFVYHARPRKTLAITWVLGTLVIGWLLHHTAVLAGLIDYPAAYPVLFTLLFLLMGQQLLMSWFEKPFDITPEQHNIVRQLKIGIVVPLYNEDESILLRNLFALLDQSRRPTRIVVVNDGSLNRQTGEAILYESVKNEWVAAAERAGVSTLWLYQSNAGKRHAQVTGFRHLTDVDIIVTVDSDSMLDHYAIEEGVKPFIRTEVMSVGGVNIGINTHTNFLTRLSDLLHVQWQLVARGAQNAGGNITVNSGRLAFYRAKICLDNIEAYLGETFFGRRVEYSDDSMLTMFALSQGRAVQQTTSITFTWHPENFDYLMRQRLRWMRGWFIRSFWRFRYLPVKGYAFWSEAFDMLRLVLGTVVTVLVLIVRPVMFDRPLVWTLFVVPIVMTYLTSVKHLTIWHSDQSTHQRVLTFAMAPLVLIWAWLILRPLRLYAMATWFKTGWGTREVIEVVDHPTHQQVGTPMPGLIRQIGVDGA